MLSKASGADLKLHVIIEMEGAYRTGADLQLHVIIEADGAYTCRTSADLELPVMKQMGQIEQTLV